MKLLKDMDAFMYRLRLEDIKEKVIFLEQREMKAFVESFLDIIVIDPKVIASGKERDISRAN